MARNESKDELFDEKVAELSAKAFDDWLVRIKAKDQRAISDMHNCALDRLSTDDAKAIFIAALTDSKVGSELFAAAVRSAMLDEVEVQAIKHAERIEQRRIEEARYARIERRAYDSHFPALA